MGGIERQLLNWLSLEVFKREVKEMAVLWEVTH